MKHARNQHYVPQLYLRRFAADNRKKNPAIYLFDKTTGETHRPSIRNVAAELHFYERGDLGIEKAFTEIEDAFVTPFQKLQQIRSLADLNEEDVAAVIVFMGAQFVRTREHRSTLKSMTLGLRERLDRDGFTYDAEFTDVSDETLRERHVAMIPDLVAQCSEVMLQMKPILLVNHSAMPLWTSDHPITLHNSIDAGPRGNLGLTCRGIELHFPLSPTRSLSLCDPVTFADLPAMLESNDVSHAMFLNSLQAISSTRFLFGNKPDFSMATSLLSEHPRYRDPDRMRMQVN